MSDGIEEKKQRLAEEKKRIAIKEKLLKLSEKKKQASQYVDIGRLAALVKIDQMDKDHLLGAFLEISKKFEDNKVLQKWKQEADTFRTNYEEIPSVPLVIIFTSEPSKDAKDKLKNAKFKWNAFRKEYYGYGNKQPIESLLSEESFQIECPELESV